MAKKEKQQEELLEEGQHWEKDLQEEEDKKIKFDFIKSEYEYFIENCMFSELQEKILKYKIKGLTYIEMSFKLNVSVDTIKYHIKKIKNKIRKVIKERI